MGIAIRLIGISHSFPFIFHPDEPTIVRSALGIRFFKNPGHFDWPHLYIYLNYFLYMVFAKLRDLIQLLGYKEYTYFLAPIIWNDKLIFYLLTRVFSAVLGALTALPIFLIGRDLFGRRAGLLSALAFAVVPFHVWHSHYSLADVPMTFFLTWSLYFSTRILFKKNVSNYLLAGLFAGLAASTKYNGAIIIFAILLAHFFRLWWERSEKIISLESLENLVFAGITSLIGFVAGTPFAVLDYQTFLRTDGPKGALWQFKNVGSLPLGEHIREFILIFPEKLFENFGYTFAIMFLVSVFYILLKIIKDKSFFNTRDLLYLNVLGMLFIYYITGFENDRAHYYFVAYPFVIISGIGLLISALEKFKFKFKYKELIWVVVFLVPVLLTLQGSYTFYRKDTRQLLYYWLQDNKRELSTVYYEDADFKPVLERVEIKNVHIKKADDMVARSVLVSEDAGKADRKLLLSIDNEYRKGPKIYIYQ